MAGNIFDTSALGKYYHHEVGTPKVDLLLADASVPRCISRLTVVELYSVLAKKVRTGVLTPSDFELLGRRFRGDVRRRKFQVARVTSLHFQAAEQLIRRLAPTCNLRTLDALQLAVALALRSQGVVRQFVCADHALCTVATAQGFTVVNPEVP